MNAPSIDLDFYAMDAIRDPAATYRRMLDAGPVVHLSPQGMHAICGFPELTTSLRDWRVFSSAEGVSMDDGVNAFLKGSTLNSDPPAHDASRTITFKPLTPKALAAVKERVETSAKAAVDAVLAKGTFDAAADLAPRVPLDVVRDLVGLGPHGSEHMLSWGHATFELMGDARERKPAALEGLAGLRTFLEREEVWDDLTADGWAKAATDAGLAQGRSEDEARKLMRDYIAPSLDTTISALGYGLWLFAHNPEQWTALREDPSRLRNAIEEVVRLTTPIRAFTRYTMEDTQVADAELQAGERVLVVYGAANRDERRFPDPDRFDIDRDVRGHVGFGHGVHACLGMHLARLEITAVLSQLMERVVRFEPAGDPQVAQNATIFALSSAPVRAVTA